MRSWPLFTLAVLLWGASALLWGPSARAEPALRLSVEDALARASRASEDVAIARARRDRAAADVLRARSELFPQISGNASYVRTLESEFDEFFTGGGTTGGFEDLPFGQANTWRVGVSASQMLFAGGRILAATRAAAAERRRAELGLESARAQAVLDVAEAYYDAVLGDRLLVIARTATEQAERTLEVARAGFDEGTVSEFEVLRAEVAVGNQSALVVARRRERTIAVQRLKQLLDLPSDREVELTTSLVDGGGSPPPSIAEAARKAAGIPDPEWTRERIIVRQAEQVVRARQAGVIVARAGHLPSLSVSMDYAPVAYPADLFPAFDEFRTNWTVGVSLVVPIFTGGRVTGDVRAAHADLSEARAQREKTQELAQLDTYAAKLNLEEAQAAWRATAGVVQQARRAYELAGVRYEEGVSTQLEVTDARLAFSVAEGNLARAARAVQVANVRVALLPALPLGAALTRTTPELETETE